MSTLGKEIGKVIWFDRKKGFGFIKVIGPDSEFYNEEVFIHYSSINCDNEFKVLYPGECVSLDIDKNDGGGDNQKKYTTKNLTGLFGTELIIDSPKYIVKILRKKPYENAADENDGESREEGYNNVEVLDNVEDGEKNE